MSTMILDAELRGKLNGLNEVLEFQDEAGLCVGRFLPEEEYRRMCFELMAKEGPDTAEELALAYAEIDKGDGGSAIAFLKTLGAV